MASACGTMCGATVDNKFVRPKRVRREENLRKILGAIRVDFVNFFIQM